MSDSTDTTGSAATPPEAGPAPLLLPGLPGLPGLPEADGDVPVCGPDGCSVPAAASSEQR
jgi:hypothetical protein